MRRQTIVKPKTSIFSAFGCYVFGTLRNEANVILYCSIIYSPFAFSLTAKYVTLNGHFTLTLYFYEKRFRKLFYIQFSLFIEYFCYIT